MRFRCTCQDLLSYEKWQFSMNINYFQLYNLNSTTSCFTTKIVVVHTNNVLGILGNITI